MKPVAMPTLPFKLTPVASTVRLFCLGVAHGYYQLKEVKNAKN